MNGLALVGLLLIVYSLAVGMIAVKKPQKIWDMAKIKFFRKILGENGTTVFFYIFSIGCFAVGIWLLVK